MAQQITVVFNLLAFGAGLLAALYWFRSSRVAYPTNLPGTAMIGGAVSVNMNSVLEAVRENGRLNKLAALFTAAASVLTALAVIASIRECT